MNILDAFNDIERLELKLSELYLHFKRSFSDDIAAVNVFEKLSDEEKSHYDLVQYQRRVVHQNQKIFKAVDIDVKEVRAVTSNVENIIKRIPPPSLSEAIKIVIDVESSAAEVHYCAAMKQSNQEFSDFLKQLGTSDKEHFGLLRAFAESRGFSNR
jgi:rubrerythrin